LFSLVKTCVQRVCSFHIFLEEHWIDKIIAHVLVGSSPDPTHLRNRAVICMCFYTYVYYYDRHCCKKIVAFSLNDHLRFPYVHYYVSFLTCREINCIYFILFVCFRKKTSHYSWHVNQKTSRDWRSRKSKLKTLLGKEGLKWYVANINANKNALNSMFWF